MRDSVPESDVASGLIVSVAHSPSELLIFPTKAAYDPTRESRTTGLPTHLQLAHIPTTAGFKPLPVPSPPQVLSRLD